MQWSESLAKTIYIDMNSMLREKAKNKFEKADK